MIEHYLLLTLIFTIAIIGWFAITKHGQFVELLYNIFIYVSITMAHIGTFIISLFKKRG